jgi:prevent-host-death family protein
MAEHRVSIGRLKARLSQYLRQVRAGESVVVTDRGRPVARLMGLEGEKALSGRSEELVRSGLARRPVRPLSSAFLKIPRPSDAEGRSLEAVLEERGESR